MRFKYGGFCYRIVRDGVPPIVPTALIFVKFGSGYRLGESTIINLLLPKSYHRQTVRRCHRHNTSSSSSDIPLGIPRVCLPSIPFIFWGAYRGWARYARASTTNNHLTNAPAPTGCISWKKKDTLIVTAIKETILRARFIMREESLTYTVTQNLELIDLPNVRKERPRVWCYRPIAPAPVSQSFDWPLVKRGVSEMGA